MLILLLSFPIEVEHDDEDEVRSISTPHGLEMKVSDLKDGLDSLYSYCKPDSMTSSIVKSLEEDALYPFAYASIFLLQVLNFTIISMNCLILHLIAQKYF